jgi:hypothetical protein
MWGAAQNDLWAVGRAGAILHWDEQQWQGVSAFAPDELHGIHGASDTDVWAVGNLGTILHWNGHGWIAGFLGARYELRGVWALNEKTAWAVGIDLEARPKEDDEDEDEENDTAPEVGVIMKWDGKKWAVDRAAPKNLPRLDFICGFSRTNVWASGADDHPQVVHRDGKRWAKQKPRVGRTAPTCSGGKEPQFVDGARTAWAGATGEAWAIKSPGSVAHRVDGKWADVPAGFAGELHAVWSAAGDDAWAVGESGSIIHWDGKAWQVLSGAKREAWVGIAGTTDNDVWVSSASHTLHWDGSNWSVDSSKPVAPNGLELKVPELDHVSRGARILALAKTDAESWAITSDGPAWQIGTRRILHTTPNGWSDVPLPTHHGEKVALRDLRILAPGEVLVSSATSLFVWRDEKWIEIPTGAQGGFAALWDSPTTVWIATESGAVLTLSKERLRAIKP